MWVWDTHALSESAFASAVEVLAANGVETCIQAGLGFTPTPVISTPSCATMQANWRALADGVVITPSHNPPEDGGSIYPPHGGPPRGIAKWVRDRQRRFWKRVWPA